MWLYENAVTSRSTGDQGGIVDKLGQLVGQLEHALKLLPADGTTKDTPRPEDGVGGFPRESNALPSQTVLYRCETEPRRRHQVFVSSTFLDLRAERQAVLRVLLKLDCIPAGMELFAAESREVWELIKREIDDSDYYLVIVAGRYGSTFGDDGTSYTEREYQYAMEKHKPIIGFLHDNPAALPPEKAEDCFEKRKRLSSFRNTVAKRQPGYWSSPDGLAAEVGVSLPRLRQCEHAAGWIRGGSLQPLTVPSHWARESAAMEILIGEWDLRHQDETGRYNPERLRIDERGNYHIEGYRDNPRFLVLRPQLDSESGEMKLYKVAPDGTTARCEVLLVESRDRLTGHNVKDRRRVEYTRRT